MGGMGHVYRAHDRATGRRVALKLLQSVADTERLLREAEVIRDLSHPRIVRHVAHGLLHEGAWFAME